MTTYETLRRLPYFADLPDDTLLRVCAKADEVTLQRGEVLFEEGTESTEMYVVVEGDMEVSKLGGGRPVVLAHLGAGEVLGEIAILDDVPRTATVTAASDARLVRVPGDEFKRLLDNPNVVLLMLRTVTSRLRSMEAGMRHEERMASLGRMAAGLMHELNNPAAAVQRSTVALLDVYTALGDQGRQLAAAEGLPFVELPSPSGEPPRSAIERADSEEEMSDWLERHGVEDPWEIAPGLVEAGWTSDDLDALVVDVDADVAPTLARWMGLRTLAGQLLDEVRIGAERISDLVRVVKDYSYLDQAPIQDVDLQAGIEDTLKLLKHKLGSEITVSRDYDPEVPSIEAYGRELNQIWTNLIDNAADAMPDGGELTIRTSAEDGMVLVEIADTGTGVPADVVERMFDPFFTTKEPGKGTGLGLHTVHTIVAKHGGDIAVDSGEAGTVFRVSLPTKLVGPVTPAE